MLGGTILLLCRECCLMLSEMLMAKGKTRPGSVKHARGLVHGPISCMQGALAMLRMTIRAGRHTDYKQGTLTNTTLKLKFGEVPNSVSSCGTGNYGSILLHNNMTH
eukprot:97013-Amphidinium_carterae.1